MKKSPVSSRGFFVCRLDADRKAVEVFLFSLSVLYRFGNVVGFRQACIIVVKDFSNRFRPFQRDTDECPWEVGDCRKRLIWGTNCLQAPNEVNGKLIDVRTNPS